jgi:hypothetical protein
MTKGPLSTGGGEGGRIEEFDWDDNLVWEFDFSTSAYMQHHDVCPLPNGNILILAVEKKTIDELLEAGFNPDNFQPNVSSAGYMLPEFVAEVRPTPPSGGVIVWEWHLWDHLIQDNYQDKANYGTVADHPELVDVDGDGKKLPSFWNHANAIDYNASFDQIMLSVRNNSEIWIIDHSTTTAEAQSHSGGRSGKGGDLLFRWGNPVCYKLGTWNDQKLYQQHDAQWIDAGRPGTGNILVFNNGLGRNYSTVDEFTPPVDTNGVYSRSSGSAFGPMDFIWSYKATPPESMFSDAISGAQRLPNGNTLIDDGVHGTFIEVTEAGGVAWKYVNPVVGTGPLIQGDTIPNDPSHTDQKLNAVFRVQRYPVNYGAFTGRDLTPGGFIEQTVTSVEPASSAAPSCLELMQSYPNPFSSSAFISYRLSVNLQVRLTVENAFGQVVAVLHDGVCVAGQHTAAWNAAGAPSGVYTLRCVAGGITSAKQMVLVK